MKKYGGKYGDTGIGKIWGSARSACGRSQVPSGCGVGRRLVEGLEGARRGLTNNAGLTSPAFPTTPGYRRRERPTSKKLGPFMAWIDAILEGDSQVHKKQRHTALRIFERLRDEQGFSGGYTIVREYVAAARLRAREMFVDEK